MLADGHLLKVVLLGDSGVGKTALMKMYCTQKFDKSYQPTIGADFITKALFISDDQPITLQIWDTAGQERFKSLVCQFYRGADACILVYDITSPQSFERMEFWMDQFVEHANIQDPKRFPFLVVGNKQDLHQEQKVSEGQVRAWCESKGNIPFIQTSAKGNHNVEEAFVTVTTRALEIQSDFEDIVPSNMASVLSAEDFANPDRNSGQADTLSGAHSRNTYVPASYGGSEQAQKKKLSSESRGFTLTDLSTTFRETTDNVNTSVQSTLETWDCC